MLSLSSLFVFVVYSPLLCFGNYVMCARDLLIYEAASLGIYPKSASQTSAIQTRSEYKANLPYRRKKKTRFTYNPRYECSDSFKTIRWLTLSRGQVQLWVKNYSCMFMKMEKIPVIVLLLERDFQG